MQVQDWQRSKEYAHLHLDIQEKFYRTFAGIALDVQKPRFIMTILLFLQMGTCIPQLAYVCSDSCWCMKVPCQQVGQLGTLM